MTTKVCVPGMECVHSPMVCECASGIQCVRLRARVTGHKPVCLCVSLGVSQSGSGCRDDVLEGVCIGWGTESVEARSSRLGRGLGLPSCGFLPPPPTQGWARGARARWLRIPLPLTHGLTKIFLAEGSQPRAARPAGNSYELPR